MVARNAGRPHGRRRSRRAAIAATALALLLAGCAAGTSSTVDRPSAVPPSSVGATTPSASHAAATPSVTPASWRMLPQGPSLGIHNGVPTQAVWDGTEMLIVSSRWAPNKRSCMEVGAAYNPSSDSWRRLPSMPHTGACGEPLMLDRAVWTGEEMLLWGVANAAFDPATNRWRRLPDPPTGTGGPAFAVWTGRQMIGWGGGGGDLLLNDGAAYTPATNTWRMLPPAPLAGHGRHDVVGVWTGSEVIVAGGWAPTRRGQRTFSDAAAYDPRTHAWRTLASMPVAESGASAVWDGHEALLVQGVAAHDPSTPTRRGLAFDPLLNRWRWIAPMRYPRFDSVDAWTGRLLVVWGGRADRVPPFGETYRPASNTWTPMPPSPLRARYGAVAVWTGSSLIVWGGQDARAWDRLSDGAAFTPASG
jgi:N-acetylneuraminic acid mutarotase